MNRRQPRRILEGLVKSQTVISREVRERLKLKPGDILLSRHQRRHPAQQGERTGDDPFTAFSEWRSEADERSDISSL